MSAPRALPIAMPAIAPADNGEDVVGVVPLCELDPLPLDGDVVVVILPCELDPLPSDEDVVVDEPGTALD